MEFFKILIEKLEFFNPLKKVNQWETGLYYINGRFYWSLGPGLKFVVPWFCDLKTVSMVPEIETAPLQTVTLLDGRTLTYSASLRLTVFNAALAFHAVGHYTETAVELSAGLISSMLAETDPKRLTDPSRKKRDNLLAEIRDEINTELKEFGLSVSTLRLNNFALDIPTLRLLGDKAVLQASRKEL
jgi:regulator of protease activity HflC (stomatin/prohibitin superfamily)